MPSAEEDGNKEAEANKAEPALSPPPPPPPPPPRPSSSSAAAAEVAAATPAEENEGGGGRPWPTSSAPTASNAERPPEEERDGGGGGAADFAPSTVDFDAIKVRGKKSSSVFESSDTRFFLFFVLTRDSGLQLR